MQTDPTLPTDDGAFVKPPLLPFARRYPVFIGAAVGLLLRLVFSGSAGSNWSPMVGSFIYLMPVVVGMVTVYLAERQRRRSWGYYLGAAAAATSLVVLGSLLVFIEGMICAIVIVPMFAVMGAIGGLVMGLACRLTNWPKPLLCAMGVMPLLLGAFGDALPTPEDNFGTIEHRLHIDAPPATVWRQIHEADGIRPPEMGRGWAYRIGVPLPLSGRTVDTPEGRVHRMQMGKGVHFEGVVRDWEPERRVRWTYRFAPDSFPAGALDDHVLIGGHYFDLIDTDFHLRPEAGGTDLSVRIHYRVSTEFNLYADWVARLLLGNFSEVLLDLYRDRSLAAPVPPG